MESNEICKCRCHEPGGDEIMWDMPHYCCSECRLCNLNIILSELENHKETCKNSEICKCVCHEPDRTVIHFMPCCGTCECGDRIKVESQESHLLYCKEMREVNAKKNRRLAAIAQIEDFMRTNSGRTIKRLN
jgi:hypothetical protein